METSVTTVSEMSETEANTSIVAKEDLSEANNSIFSLLLLFKRKQQRVAKSVTDNDSEAGVKDEVKLRFAKFPRRSLPPEVKLEAEDSELNNNTNPVVLWQVYVIGGFFVLRWAWARWNERRGKRGPSNGEPSLADD